LGEKAAAKGFNTAVTARRREFEQTAGGMTFRVYLDNNFQFVENFFPKF
jgi:filamentous hemagglutinin